MNTDDFYKTILEQDVVLDTATSLVYFGKIKDVNDYFITLTDVDVHDMDESRVSKSQAIMEARRDGVIPNREEVRVKQQMVVSISRLSDVRIF